MAGVTGSRALPAGIIRPVGVALGVAGTTVAASLIRPEMLENMGMIIIGQGGHSSVAAAGVAGLVAGRYVRGKMQEKLEGKSKFNENEKARPVEREIPGIITTDRKLDRVSEIAHEYFVQADRWGRRADEREYWARRQGLSATATGATLALVAASIPAPYCVPLAVFAADMFAKLGHGEMGKDEEGELRGLANTLAFPIIFLTGLALFPGISPFVVVCSAAVNYFVINRALPKYVVAKARRDADRFYATRARMDELFQNYAESKGVFAQGDESAKRTKLIEEVEKAKRGRQQQSSWWSRRPAWLGGTKGAA